MKECRKLNIQLSQLKNISHSPQPSHTIIRLHVTSQKQNHSQFTTITILLSIKQITTFLFKYFANIYFFKNNHNFDHQNLDSAIDLELESTSSPLRDSCHSWCSMPNLFSSSSPLSTVIGVNHHNQTKSKSNSESVTLHLPNIQMQNSSLPSTASIDVKDRLFWLIQNSKRSSAMSGSSPWLFALLQKYESHAYLNNYIS